MPKPSALMIMIDYPKLKALAADIEKRLISVIDKRKLETETREFLAFLLL